VDQSVLSGILGERPYFWDSRGGGDN